MLSTSRRELLRFGSACAAVGTAGCLGDVRKIADESRPTTDEDDSDTTQDGSRTVEADPDSESIDGRLHNEDEVERVFDLTITNENGDDRDGSFEVGPGETIRIPAVGSPGDVLTVEVTVDATDESETLELGGEAKPGELAGFVDVVYQADGKIEITFEPTD